MKKQTDHARFSGLDALPLSLLEKIVEADANGEIQQDSEMIEYVEGLIAARKKEAQSRKNRKRILSLVGTLAACFAVFLAVMITTQAMGVDILGTLGTWTDSKFSFVKEESQSTPPVSTVAEESDDRLRRALELLNFPTEFQPKWIPERYSMASVETFEILNLTGVTATYHYPDAKYYILIDISKYGDEAITYEGFYEKDSPSPEIYTSNGRTFYIFANAGRWVAAWSDTVYEISISGVETKEEIKKIIDSIEEWNYE